MAEPAFFAEPSRASSTTPSYLWEVPGKPVIVRIALELVDRLDREVVEIFRSPNARGSEIGGLLLGTVHGNSPFEVSLEDYEPVPCEYSRGPLYRLSPLDIEGFERVLEQRAATGVRVAGFFRSHTRKALSLDADDLAIFTRFFPNMYQVALLAKPFATKPTTGGIFIREEGSLRSESSYKEFPFRRGELERAGATVATLKTGEKTSPTPVPAPRAEPPRTTSRAQIVPIASRREMALPMPVQPADREPAAEMPAPAASPDRVTPAIPSEIPPAPAQAATVRPEALAEPHQGAVPDRKPASRPAAENADWTESFDFEKLLREGEEKAPSTEALHNLLEGPAATEPAAAAAPALAMPVLAEPALAADLTAAGTPELPDAALDDAAFGKRRSARLMWIAGGSAAALIVLSGLLVFPGLLRTKRPAPAASQDASTMSLRVERSAGELLLTWNRDSDAIRTATHAVLSIADGERHESVDLDLAQLRNGSIVYSPSSADIVFQLTVTGRSASQKQSESVRVLRTRPSPMPDPPSASPAKPNRTSGANVPAAAGGAVGDEARQANDVALRPFQTDTLSDRLRPARASDLPDAPGLTSGQQPQEVLLPGEVAAPAPPQANQPPAPPPTPQPRVGGQVREAQVLTQTTPDYPLAARQARVQGSVVVLAVVGPDGHIKSAKPVSGPPLLLNSAAAAVRHWVYKPATLNGIPVESETRIELNFTLQH